MSPCQRGGSATACAISRWFARCVLERRRGLMQAWADFLTREPAQVVPLRIAG
jgi:hypothetical protein